MAALDTVAKITASARVLLQDLIEPFRYSTLDLVNALNMGLLEARRLRPDLFLSTPTAVQSFTEADAAGNVLVTVDQQYRMPLVYFVCGQAQLRDEEETQDARASAFLQKFTQILTGA